MLTFVENCIGAPVGFMNTEINALSGGSVNYLNANALPLPQGQLLNKLFVNDTVDRIPDGHTRLNCLVERSIERHFNAVQ